MRHAVHPQRGCNRSMYFDIVPVGLSAVCSHWRWSGVRAEPERRPNDAPPLRTPSHAAPAPDACRAAPKISGTDGPRDVLPLPLLVVDLRQVRHGVRPAPSSPPPSRAMSSSWSCLMTGSNMGAQGHMHGNNGGPKHVSMRSGCGSWRLQFTRHLRGCCHRGGEGTAGSPARNWSRRNAKDRCITKFGLPIAGLIGVRPL